jgi:hypothetical protein
LANNTENGSSFFSSNSGRRSDTTASTGLLEEGFKSLFLVVDGKSTWITCSGSESINL